VILLGQGMSREKIVTKMQESMRGEVTSQVKKYSMSDSKLVEAFLDALRSNSDDSGEGAQETELRSEFQRIMLPYLLCSTAAQGNVVQLQELLRFGANPKGADYDARTPLHLACSEGHLDTVRILIDCGADVNARDRWGRTPLDEARRLQKPTLLELLASHGALAGPDLELRLSTSGLPARPGSPPIFRPPSRPPSPMIQIKRDDGNEKGIN